MFDRLTIFVDGPDHAGKSTLIPTLRRALEHKAQVWERWIGTDYVYDSIKAKPQSGAGPWPVCHGMKAEAALRQWYSQFTNLVQVVVIPSPILLAHRSARLGEPISSTVALGLEEQVRRYTQWAEFCQTLGFRTISIYDHIGLEPVEYVQAIRHGLDLSNNLLASGVYNVGSQTCRFSGKNPVHVTHREDSDRFSVECIAD